MTIEFEEQLAPSANAYDVQSFLDAWNAEPRTLELRPPFQRNLVWNDDQRSYLVDSILRGLPVPELYLQKKTSPDGEQQILVVDGQQRINACIEFVHDEFALATSETKLDPRWDGKRFKELSPELRARFRNFGFIGRQLPVTLDEVALREIFQRLNRTVEALEAQELRHAAYNGDFIQLVERAADSNGLEELGVFSAKDVQRRRHDAFISEVFHAVLLGTSPNKKDGLDELYMTFERQGLPDDSREMILKRFGRVERFLSSHGSRIKKTRFRNKSDAYTLLVFLIEHAENVPPSEPDANPILETLENFSALVNKIKKAETAGEPMEALASQQYFTEASQYLHAVERAASDRLSRVRRSTSLANALEPIFGGLAAVEFTGNDNAWLSSDVEPDQDESDASAASELEIARRVLEDDLED
ncbi:MAG: DUF262 domain-containing protein [Salinibacterium amurskyense]